MSPGRRQKKARCVASPLGCPVTRVPPKLLQGFKLGRALTRPKLQFTVLCEEATVPK